MKILTALLELETLKGEQKDTKEEIDNKLLELETLLDAGDSTSLGFSFNIENVVSSSLSDTQATQVKSSEPGIVQWNGINIDQKNAKVERPCILVRFNLSWNFYDLAAFFTILMVRLQYIFCLDVILSIRLPAYL